MSSRPTHETAARANLELLDRISPDHDRGWYVTILYYAAIQRVEAFLADANGHPRSHDERHRTCSALRPSVGPPWRKLKQLSEDWRYAGLIPELEEVRYAKRWASDMCAAISEPWPDL